MTEEPLVSVCCIAYNHERYIAEAVEGFLAQRIAFPFEIIIHDDCSTDRTADIIRSYQQRHPRLIKTCFQTENQYSKGRRIFSIIFARAAGKYLALCEGDDYWTDPDKLARQVALMEANPDYSFCFHPVNRLDQATGETVARIKPPVVKETYTADDLFEHGNFIPTCSTLFRAGLVRDYPDWYYQATYGDFAFFVHAARLGPVGFVDEPMAVHRLHGAGAWGGRSYRAHLERFISTYEVIADGMRARRRDSFRRGFARLNLELRHAYLEEGERGRALRAAWAALLAAPAPQKPYIVKTLVKQLSRGMMKR